jgi:hypothetical protein
MANEQEARQERWAMFHYDTQDRATNIGYFLGDVFVIVFGILFIWAVFGHH